MVKIRLSRLGRKKRPSYRVVIADDRAPRDGAFIEIIGHYNPLTDPATIVIDEEKALNWISKGAQPTERVSILLARLGIIEKPTKKYTEKLAKKLAEEKAEKPTKKPAKKTKEEPTAELVEEKPAEEEPAAEPVEEPTTELVEEKPAEEEPAAEPVEEPTAELVEDKPAEEEPTAKSKE
ncbi:MAG: 30S ribosomal protein S16 [Dehalococcoidia bacterium]|nr:30S ribosomal protein S16 [Dehalococcoidia bacterium]